MIKHFFQAHSILILALILIACGGQDKNTAPFKTFTVKPRPLDKMLYFTGIVQPINENAITSPVDAVVERMHFHFGQRVKKGEVLFVLNSLALQRQYNSSLTEYLKAKDNYSIAKAKFTGTKSLWQAGLMAKNNYLSEQSSLVTLKLALMQARFKLLDTLKTKGEQSTTISSLHLADFDKIKKLVFSSQSLLFIKTPYDGVLLYPPKSGEEKTKYLSVGSSIKAGQIMALVGDLSGVSVEIEVPEVDISYIKPGMPATITGVAFGKNVLKGEVLSVNAQAISTSAGGLPSFNAIVQVRSLPKAAQSWVKVGMSASIAVSKHREN